jgi:hypothetical protein
MDIAHVGVWREWEATNMGQTLSQRELLDLHNQKSRLMGPSSGMNPDHKIDQASFLHS